VKNALVIGCELISPFMDWSDRNVAVLFGDGAAAVVLQATDREEGLLAERLGCYGESREILRVHGMGGGYAHQNRILGKTEWQFEGQEIFKKAVHGMASACAEALGKLGKGPDDVDLVIPHQANMRIIESVAKKAGVPMERVFVNVHRYGNMSAATIPVALCEALEEGRVKPGALLLMPSFGGGLTFTGHVVRWGQRISPIATTHIDLPANNQSALEIVERYRRIVNSPARAT
jgi:3-oxoacyl-[acyl-carrier-protein] synthase-3